MDTNGNINFVPIRGLKDLNNTCWFNCILQCLKQTPGFVQLLEENSQPGQKFLLPGGKLKLDDESSALLPALDCTLEKPRILTNHFLTTLSNLAINTATAYKPRILYSLVVTQIPRYERCHQHDAYEFLKSFLGALRMEDIRRHQVAILKKMELTTKSDPLLVNNDKKRIIKFYGLQIHDVLKSPTEELFRGSIKNIQMCQCTKTTHQVESFFDLCLPIPKIGNHSSVKRERHNIKCGGKLSNAEYDADDEESSQETRTKVKSRQNFNENEDLKERSVELCLRNFFAIKDDNESKCDECTKQNEKISIRTQLKICNPPSVLVLNFERFRYVRHRIRKISALIKFSTVLDITSFCCTDYLNSSKQNKVLYSLYAVVKHSGKTPNRGRYVSYIKVKTASNKYKTGHQVCQPEETQTDEVFPEKWYYTNDELVEEISESDVLRTQAYVLLYERIF